MSSTFKTEEIIVGNGVEYIDAEIHASNIATIIAHVSAARYPQHSIDVAIKAYWEYIAGINANMNKLIPEEGEAEQESSFDGKPIC